MGFKPLKAAKAELDLIEYPVYTTPKLDGIRCMIHNSVAMSINMKPIPNQHIQDVLQWCEHGLDGELMVDGDFNSVQSAVMKRTGTPDFYYAVFDDFSDPTIPYQNRIKRLNKKCKDSDPNIVRRVEHELISNNAELQDVHAHYMAQGYEGTMIRNKDGIYKYGRSTGKQGILLKLKDWEDSEGVILGFVEKHHNENTLEQDELGYAKRSTSKENLVPAGTAAGVMIQWAGLEFKIGFGPGFTDTIKQYIWDNQERFLGQIGTFSYQNLSKDGIPRFGKLLRFRDTNDMTDEDLHVLGKKLV